MDSFEERELQQALEEEGFRWRNPGEDTTPQLEVLEKREIRPASEFLQAWTDFGQAVSEYESAAALAATAVLKSETIRVRQRAHLLAGLAQMLGSVDPTPVPSQPPEDHAERP